MVDGDRFEVVADRVSAETLIAAERVPAWLLRPGETPREGAGGGTRAG